MATMLSKQSNTLRTKWFDAVVGSAPATGRHRPSPSRDGIVAEGHIKNNQLISYV
jgi:hypothetical protein